MRNQVKSNLGESKSSIADGSINDRHINKEDVNDGHINDRYINDGDLTSSDEDESGKYRCTKCKDVTYILTKEGAVPCSCKSIRESEMMLKKSGISKEFANKTFDSLDYSCNMQIFNAYNMAREYVMDFEEILDNRQNSIIFMGSVGGGKSHLSFAIANDLMKKGKSVIYMGYRDAIIKMKQNVMNMDVYEKIIKKYKDCKVLMIDDLFKGNITGSDINIIFEIVNHRYFNNLPMIISTEKNMDELLQIDEAIGSRILEMCRSHTIELKGRKLNYRL